MGYFFVFGCMYDMLDLPFLAGNDRVVRKSDKWPFELKLKTANNQTTSDIYIYFNKWAVNNYESKEKSNTYTTTYH